MIEIATGICKEAEAAEQLAALRDGLLTGLPAVSTSAFCGGGAHPSTLERERRISDGPRYKPVERSLRLPRQAIYRLRSSMSISAAPGPDEALPAAPRTVPLHSPPDRPVGVLTYVQGRIPGSTRPAQLHLLSPGRSCSLHLTWAEFQDYFGPRWPTPGSSTA